MNCHSCKLNFWFVCLKPMINESWQCGGIWRFMCSCTCTVQNEGNDFGKIQDTTGSFLDILEEIENVDVAQQEHMQSITILKETVISISSEISPILVNSKYTI